MGFRRFQSFCKQHGVAPIPASRHVVALFATYLSNSLSWKTIQVYLSAITYQHHLNGFQSPITDNPTLQLVLRGIKRQQSRIHPRCRKPISIQVLSRLMGKLWYDTTLCTHDRLMLRAAMSLAFFGFLRVGEFTSSTLHSPTRFLARRDISLSKDQMKVFLRFSKTDQLGKGCTVTVGRSGGACCPVRAMHTYLNHCRAPGSKPVFHLKSRGPLTAKFFRSTLHHLLRRSGLNPSHFNTHSFRIGAATAAAKAGISSTKIMQLGRWRSSAFQGYIHHTPSCISAAALMAAAP